MTKQSKLLALVSKFFLKLNMYLQIQTGDTRLRILSKPLVLTIEFSATSFRSHTNNKAGEKTLPRYDNCLHEQIWREAFLSENDSKEQLTISTVHCCYAQRRHVQNTNIPSRTKFVYGVPTVLKTATKQK